MEDIFSHIVIKFAKKYNIYYECVTINKKIQENVLKKLNEEELYDVLLDASLNGNVQIISELLKNPKVDFSRDESKALRYAVGRNKLKAVKEILKHPNINPNAAYNASIKEAIDIKSKEICLELQKHKKFDKEFAKNYIIGCFMKDVRKDKEKEYKEELKKYKYEDLIINYFS